MELYIIEESEHVHLYMPLDQEETDKLLMFW